ncbi:MAG: glycoside hydrolase family 97 protein [Bacteroidota bacterium]|nr:glycoside hydrolase family 97 protein [Bacteroidota bacterium]
MTKKAYVVKAILTISIFFLIAGCFAQSGLKMTSPDKQVVVRFFTAHGRTFYTLKYNNRPILGTSATGLILNQQPLMPEGQLKFSKKYTICARYLSLGVHSNVLNHCNGYVIKLNRAGPYSIEVRVYNDGLAFRYMVHQNGENRVTTDLSSFNIPPGNSIWYQTDTTSYEGVFKHKMADTLNPGEIMGPPVTVQFTKGLYAAITEGDLTNFGGMRLESTSHHLLHANLAGHPVMTGNFNTPWRIISVAKDLNMLVNNDLISNVSDSYDKKLFPAGALTSWIRPGKSLWSWLADNGPVTLENMKRYSKWAGELGFEYNLVDEGWSNWSDTAGHRDAWDMMKDLVDYSATQHVKIWVWKAYPDRKGIPGLKDSTQRLLFFKKCHELGIAGLKIDFFDGEGQQIIKFYQAALRDAAKYHLMIDFHGSNKPTGESRTWPNELSREAVMGLEYDGPHACQNTIIPFTRLLAGHADYTPLQLGKLKGERTLPHHIATALTFTSPLLCMALNPEELLKSHFKDFITSIPTTWDETVVLPQSQIGSVSVFARRKRRDWYLAVINNNQAKDLSIALSFLPDGDFEGILLKDDPSGKQELITEKRILTNTKKLKINLVASGGFVARFSKVPDRAHKARVK